jgi:2-polyprenyl-3-methyl-5-hydroxy-6-metoxy-1,4-benzoquinol methylase
MTHKNCYYCKQNCNLYLKSSNKGLNENYNFTSTETDTYKSEIKPDLYFCTNCEIIFSEFIDKKFENNYRDVLDNLYISQIKNKRMYFESVVSKLSNLIKKKYDVLELGSYYGAFGSQIKDKVNTYVGVELSSHACDYAKKEFNLNVQNTSIYDFFESNQKKYDIIFMFDVLEHLDDPDSVIKLCSNNLRENGALIFSTMNMNSLMARVTGRYYPWIIPMHKFYFTNKSVKKYLLKNNLKLDKIIGDVRIVSLEYLFLKISQKINIFKYIYNFIIKFDKLKNSNLKFSLFDINIYLASKDN